MRKRPYYLIIFFVIILTSIIMAGCPTPEVIEEPGSKWVQVPLRNVEQKVKGYYGGETGQMAFSIDICEANPDYLALAIDTAGVYISKDGANSWELKWQGIMCNGVQSITFDPGNPQILWAAGLNGTLPNPQVEGIYRTMNGGETWNLLRSAVYQSCQAQNEYFAFDPDSFDGTQHNTVYVATHDQGLLKTINGGETWQSLGFQNEQINAIIIHPLNQNLLFLASETGLYISENTGNTFFKVEGGLPVSSPVLGLAVNAQDPDVIFVAMDSSGIWRSVNGGQNFYPIMNGIPEWAIDQQWSWRRLCISPVDPNQIYVDANWGGPFPYWSNNGGDNWYPPEYCEATFFDLNTADPNHWQPEGFVAHPEDPNVAYHVTPVRKTTDGGRTWFYASDGISGMRRIGRTSMTFHPDDPNKLALFHIDFGYHLLE